MTDGGKETDARILRRGQLLVEASGGEEVPRVQVAPAGGHEQVHARRSVGDVDLRGAFVQGSRRPVGDAALGLPSGEHQVVDGLARVSERASLDVVVGKLGHQARIPLAPEALEGLGHARVRGGAPGGRHAVEHRLPRQCVREAVRALAVDVCHEQAGPYTEVEALEGHARTLVTGRSDDRRVDEVASDCGQLDHPRVLGPDSGQPTFEGVLDRPRRRHGRGPDGIQPPAGRQVVPVLVQEEGVASREVPQHRSGHTGGPGRPARLVQQEVDDVLGLQPDEVDAVDPVEAIQVRQRVGDRVGAVRGRGPACDEDQESFSRRRLDQVRQHGQGRLGRPVQVLDHQHGGPALGDGHQHPEHGVEQDRPGLALVRRTLLGFGPVAADAGREAGQGRRDLRWHTSQLAGCSGVEHLLEDRDEGSVRNVEVSAACAPQDGGPVVVQGPGGLSHEPRLAHAGLPADEHDLATVVLHGRPDLLESFEVRPAADEPRVTPRRGRVGHRSPGDHHQVTVAAGAPPAR